MAQVHWEVNLGGDCPSRSWADPCWIGNGVWNLSAVTVIQPGDHYLHSGSHRASLWSECSDVLKWLQLCVLSSYHLDCASSRVHCIWLGPFRCRPLPYSQLSILVLTRDGYQAAWDGEVLERPGKIAHVHYQCVVLSLSCKILHLQAFLCGQ